MIGYLRGKITYKSPAYLLVECGGIGYQVYISLNTYSHIEEAEAVKLYTHLQVTETAHTLYGFADTLEKELFMHLISVSGIGPATARLALSSLSPEELKRAIINGNVATVKSIKGVGPKSAQRIILELKDKLVKSSGEEILSTPQSNSYHDEALSALVALGFNKNQAEKALDKVSRSDEPVDGVEHLIKHALKMM